MSGPATEGTAPSTLLYLGAEDLAAIAPLGLLIDAASDAALSRDTTAPDRQHLTLDGVAYLTMPSAAAGAFGLKLVSVTPANAGGPLPVTQGLMILMDGRNGTPVALLDGAALTCQRTAAVGALAARHLAPPGTASFGIVGCGVQGAWQAIYIAAETGARTAFVYARSDDAFSRFRNSVGRFAPDLAIERCADARSVATRTDLIVTATTSSTQVLPDDRALLRGKTLISIGSFRPAMQELPDTAYALAGAIVVDSPHAIHEVGDVANPVAQGLVPADAVIGVTDLVSGAWRPAPGTTRIFKSVGHASFDLFAARLFHRLAQERGIGQELPR